MSAYLNNTEALFLYLQSMVKLEELQKMTEDLDKELEDSQRLMSEIKSIFNNAPNGEDMPELNSELRREQMERFLAAGGARMLMPDMEPVDVNIDTVLADFKTHIEDLKKTTAPPENQQVHSDTPIESLNLEQFATSMDEFSKRLANIKFDKSEGNNTNAVLEMKFTQLREDANNLTQVIQTKTKVAQAEVSTSKQCTNANVLCYDMLINNLLHSINEMTYLLKNSN